MAASAPVAAERVTAELAALATLPEALPVAIAPDKVFRSAADGCWELMSARCRVRIHSMQEPHRRRSARSSTAGISDIARTCQ